MYELPIALAADPKDFLVIAWNWGATRTVYNAVHFFACEKTPDLASAPGSANNNGEIGVPPDGTVLMEPSNLFFSIFRDDVESGQVFFQIADLHDKIVVAVMHDAAGQITTHEFSLGPVKQTVSPSERQSSLVMHISSRAGSDGRRGYEPYFTFQIIDRFESGKLPPAITRHIDRLMSDTSVSHYYSIEAGLKLTRIDDQSYRYQIGYFEPIYPFDRARMWLDWTGCELDRFPLGNSALERYFSQNDKEHNKGLVLRVFVPEALYKRKKLTGIQIFIINDHLIRGRRKTQADDRTADNLANQIAELIAWRDEELLPQVSSAFDSYIFFAPLYALSKKLQELGIDEHAGPYEDGDRIEIILPLHRFWPYALAPGDRFGFIAPSDTVIEFNRNSTPVTSSNAGLFVFRYKSRDLSICSTTEPSEPEIAYILNRFASVQDRWAAGLQANQPLHTHSDQLNGAEYMDEIIGHINAMRDGSSGTIHCEDFSEQDKRDNSIFEWMSFWTLMHLATMQTSRGGGDLDIGGMNEHRNAGGRHYANLALDIRETRRPASVMSLLDDFLAGIGMSSHQIETLANWDIRDLSRFLTLVADKEKGPVILSTQLMPGSSEYEFDVKAYWQECQECHEQLEKSNVRAIFNWFAEAASDDALKTKAAQLKAEIAKAPGWLTELQQAALSVLIDHRRNELEKGEVAAGEFIEKLKGVLPSATKLDTEFVEIAGVDPKAEFFLIVERIRQAPGVDKNRLSEVVCMFESTPLDEKGCLKVVDFLKNWETNLHGPQRVEDFVHDIIAWAGAGPLVKQVENRLSQFTGDPTLAQKVAELSKGLPVNALEKMSSWAAVGRLKRTLDGIDREIDAMFAGMSEALIQADLPEADDVKRLARILACHMVAHQFDDRFDQLVEELDRHPPVNIDHNVDHWLLSCLWMRDALPDSVGDLSDKFNALVDELELSEGRSLVNCKISVDWNAQEVTVH